MSAPALATSDNHIAQRIDLEKTATVLKSGDTVTSMVSGWDDMVCYKVNVSAHMDVRLKLKAQVVVDENDDEYTGVWFCMGDGIPRTNEVDVDVCPNCRYGLLRATGTPHIAYIWVRGSLKGTENGLVNGKNSFSLTACPVVENCINAAWAESAAKGKVTVNYRPFNQTERFYNGDIWQCGGSKFKYEAYQSNVCKKNDVYKMALVRVGKSTKNAEKVVKLSGTSGKVTVNGLKSGKKYRIYIKTIRKHAGKAYSSGWNCQRSCSADANGLITVR